MLAPVLTPQFRRSMTSIMFPASGKLALVLFFPKRGDRSEPSDYRPIVQTPFSPKFFESIVNSQILKPLDRCKHLSDHQYWYRKTRSDGDLSCVSHLWSAALLDNGKSFVIT